MYICICTYVTVCPDIYRYVFELLRKPVKYLSKLLRQQLCKASTRMNKQKSRVTKKMTGRLFQKDGTTQSAECSFLALYAQKQRT